MPGCSGGNGVNLLFNRPLFSRGVRGESPPEAVWLVLNVPSQTEIDRELSAYEAYVWAVDVQYDHERALVLNRGSLS